LHQEEANFSVVVRKKNSLEVDHVGMLQFPEQLKVFFEKTNSTLHLLPPIIGWVVTLARSGAKRDRKKKLKKEWK
jgi:hypothetical protein